MACLSCFLHHSSIQCTVTHIITSIVIALPCRTTTFFSSAGHYRSCAKITVYLLAIRTSCQAYTSIFFIRIAYFATTAGIGCFASISTADIGVASVHTRIVTTSLGTAGVAGAGSSTARANFGSCPSLNLRGRTA